MSELSEQERAVYDRQLRVWGVQTQQNWKRKYPSNRLNAAKLLIVGASGLAAEVAKNIVLAGVGSLTLMAPDAPDLAGTETNFLLNRGSAAAPLRTAEDSVATLQEMNPLVKVLARAMDLQAEADKSFLKGYDVVVLVDASLAFAQEIDTLCTEYGVKFFGAQSRGTTSFFFVNLHKHTFFPTAHGAEGKQQVEQSEARFVPLARALRHPWSSLDPRRTHKLYLALRVMDDLEKQLHGSGVATQQEHVPELLKMRDKVAEAEGVSPSMLPDSWLQQYASSKAQMPPVNAILGGVLANEVLKAVSGKGEVVNNFFFFSLADGNGIVECIQ